MLGVHMVNGKIDAGTRQAEEGHCRGTCEKGPGMLDSQVSSVNGEFLYLIYLSNANCLIAPF